MAKSASQHMESAQDIDLQAELASSRARIAELEAEIGELRELIDGDPRPKLELALYFALDGLKLEEIVPTETLCLMLPDFMEVVRKSLDESRWRRWLWTYSAASVRDWCTHVAEVAQAAADPQVGDEEFRALLRK